MKAIHQNLVRTSDAPYGTRLVYHTMHPLDWVLQPGYFRAQVGALRVGDTLDIIRKNGAGRPVELIETLVVQEHGQGVDLFVKHRHDIPAEIRPPEAPPKALAKGEFTVKRAFGGSFQILDEGGQVVSEHGSKKEAQGVADQLMGRVAA